MSPSPELFGEKQWKTLRPLFPEPQRRKDGQGRRWAGGCECLQGILLVLRTGARFQAVGGKFESTAEFTWAYVRLWTDAITFFVGIYTRALR